MLKVASTSSAVGVTVGGDHVLVDALGCFDLDVLVEVEQAGQAYPLAVGEEPDLGVEGPATGVKRVAGSSAMAVKLLLNTPVALIEGVASETDHVEGVHHGDRCGELFRSSGLEAGEAIHRGCLDSVVPCLGSLSQPRLEHLFRTTWNHVEQPCWSRAVTHGGEVDDDGDVLVAVPGVLNRPGFGGGPDRKDVRSGDRRIGWSACFATGASAMDFHPLET